MCYHHYGIQAFRNHVCIESSNFMGIMENLHILLLELRNMSHDLVMEVCDQMDLRHHLLFKSLCRVGFFFPSSKWHFFSPELSLIYCGCHNIHIINKLYLKKPLYLYFKIDSEHISRPAITTNMHVSHKLCPLESHVYHGMLLARH